MRTPSSPTPIDRATLTIVSGGVSRAQQDERILDKIQSLAGAVSDVGAQQQQQKPNPGAAMLPIIAMKMMKPRTA